MKQFIKNMLSTGTPESSKRVMGCIGFIFGIVYVGVLDRTLIDTLLYLSAALIGLETVVKPFNK